MKNFIFKSSKDFGLIKNVSNQLTLILTELRHQRSDNDMILSMLTKIVNAANLQKQVDEFYEEDNPQLEDDKSGN